jgi:hypothetical protein
MVAWILSIISSVVSAILVYILQSIYRENRRLKREEERKRIQHDTAITNGMCCILRKHLMDEHELWVGRGYITSKALESGLLMYKSYKALGGNGMIDHMEEEIQELPIKD